MGKISIALIEDHELTRVGLKAALQQQDDFEVIGEAANAKEGLEILQTASPDVALVDIGLPDMDGIELTRRFKQPEDAEVNQNGTASTREPATKILVLTMHDSEDAVMAAFAAGADSYSVKDVDLEKLIEAIRVTHGGDVWIDPAIARIVLKQAQTQQANRDLQSEGLAGDDDKADYEQVLETYPLTERELEVLELIVSGCSNAAIAERLYITVGTVKTHVCNILNKLSASDRTQAAVRALRTGLVR
ncbi:MAG: response regulator transcription factor [Cyanobacteria bacterium P01_D01_bin.128]